MPILNRRGLLAGVFMGFVAKAAGGQDYVGLQGPPILTHGHLTAQNDLPDHQLQPIKKRDDAQYAICRQRGHVAQNPEVWEGETYTGTIDDMVHSAHKVSDATPVSRYEERTESPWQTCFYCKRDFRTVTTLEER